jgi:hypothetical protein
MQKDTEKAAEPFFLIEGKGSLHLNCSPTVLITAIITERGVCKPNELPSRFSL